MVVHPQGHRWERLRRRILTTTRSGANVTPDTQTPSMVMMRLVESDRGAVPALRLIRFPDSLPEPDVRLPPHPALHGFLCSTSNSFGPTSHGLGIFVPR